MHARCCPCWKLQLCAWGVVVWVWIHCAGTLTVQHDIPCCCAGALPGEEPALKKHKR